MLDSFLCDQFLYSRLVWLFAINRTTIPRTYNCSELVCAIVDLGTVGLSVMCAHYGHNLFISLCKRWRRFFGRDQIYLPFCNFHLNICCYSVLVFVFVS